MNNRQNIPQGRDKHQASARQPVSCEPCRKRKIKCSRARAPCDTCRRRRCPESCIYIGTQNVPEPNQELLNRIDSLEATLRRLTENSQPALDDTRVDETEEARPLLSPPMETAPQQRYGLSSPESMHVGSVSSFSAFSPVSSVTPNIGTLTSCSGGNVQYEPRAAQWTAVLANTGITAPLLGDGENDQRSSGFPFSASAAPSREELIALLPPIRQCNYLKDTYFNVFSPLFHMLHDPTFMQQYDAFLEDSTSASLSWLAILFVILSLSVTSLDEDDPTLRDLARGPDTASNVRALSKRYREAAMKCLGKQGVFWGKHNIQSLQALIMLGYAMSHSQEQTWILLGMIYNVAIALACHVDPSNFDLNPIECEERRRCWAGLMMLYTIQNAFLGNPDPNRIINHSVHLPLDVNDVDITASGVASPGSGPTQVTYLLFKFQLYNLTSSICSEVFSGKTISRQTISNLDQQICAAQESWDIRYTSDASNATLPTNHKMHLQILHAYAHQLFLLLHRPFFAQSILGLDIPNESQIRCIASAEALLDIHRLIHETPEYKPYLWYSNGLGSFHAFHAAVVLAVALLMPIYKPQYRKFKAILERTKTRFEGLKSRSVVCERAAKVLHVLLSTPSPNQPGAFQSPSTEPSTATSCDGHRVPHTTETLQQPEQTTNWPVDNAGQLRFFAEHLQPQQWLGPSSVAWNEWDAFLTLSQGEICA